MPRSRKKRSVKAGLPPGTLVHIGEARALQVGVHAIRYDAERSGEQAVERIEALAPPPAGVLWLDVTGLHDAALLERLGQAFGLHPLLMEDVLNTEQRPKLEDYGDCLFIVLKRLHPGSNEAGVASEQVSLVLGRGFVISFRESESPLFDPVRQRLLGARGRLRAQGADYLAHALIDTVVDGYFEVLERFGEEIERLEDCLLECPTPQAVQSLHRMKRELIFLRKSVWPLREVIGGLERSDSALLGPGVGLYLRDVYDHGIHVIDTLESYRDMLSGMLDVYLSSLSHRMNEIMKLLTIIATIFIPLTFIAGVYGMNFRYMPELDWRWGYFASLGGMLAVALGLVAYFRRRRWF